MFGGLYHPPGRRLRGFRCIVPGSFDGSLAPRCPGDETAIVTSWPTSCSGRSPAFVIDLVSTAEGVG